ncbi:RNA polymerase sigma factor RpoD/SigA [Fibrobacterota bacterium]
MNYSEQLYFRDLDRYGLIPPEEEKEILKSVKKGDRKALHRLLVGNLRFVVSIARHYRGRGLALLELINEGNLGLYKAAKRFDPKKGVKFISYAVWWIRQTIQKALFEQVGAMRIPPNKLALVNKFKKALLQNNGNYEKTLEMEVFQDNKQDIIEVMDKLVEISLDAPLLASAENRRTESSLLDMIGGEGDQVKENEEKELRRIVDEVLNKMAEAEQKVLRMYYGINYSREFTLDEIGKELKLTRERVRQIKNKALNKLLRSKDSKEKLTPFSQLKNRSSFHNE